MQTPLKKAASALLSEEVFEPEENSDNLDMGELELDGVENEFGETALWSAERRRRLILLKSLITKLSSVQQDRFDPTDIFPGLDSWLSFLRNSFDTNEKLGQDVVYKNWYYVNIKCEDPLDSNVLFSKLFQNLQIRSSSEVRTLSVQHI